jgi:hypothetical protein
MLNMAVSLCRKLFSLDVASEARKTHGTGVLISGTGKLLHTHPHVARLCCGNVNFFLYGSTALYGPGPPRFVEISRSHTFETHHSR